MRILQACFLFFFLATGTAACASAAPTPTAMPTVAVAQLTDTPASTATKPPTHTPIPTITHTPSPTATAIPTATPTATPSAQARAQAATVRILVEGAPFLEEEIAAGNGLIIDESGLVLTQLHLVEGAGIIQIVVPGQPQPVSAEIVGRSSCDNLAVLRLFGDGYPAVPLVTAPIVGETAVFAASFPPSAPAPIVAETNLAGSDSPLATQFIPPTQPGWRTGPLAAEFVNGLLFDSGGALLGFITSTDRESSNAFIIDSLQQSITQMANGNNLNWLGLNVGLPPLSADEASPTAAGLFVYAVALRSPGAAAGVRAGDLITAIGDHDLSEGEPLQAYCQLLTGTDLNTAPIDLTLVRGDAEYAGQINGEALAEIIVPTATPAVAAAAPPAASSTSARLLNAVYATRDQIANYGYAIDVAVSDRDEDSSSGCSGQIEDSTGVVAKPVWAPAAHPGCLHLTTQCLGLVDAYDRVVLAPMFDVSAAPAEVQNAYAVYIDGRSRFLNESFGLTEICRNFLANPSGGITVPGQAWAVPRQVVSEVVDAYNLIIPNLGGQP